MSGRLSAADHAEGLTYAIHPGANAGIAKVNHVWCPILDKMQGLPVNDALSNATVRVFQLTQSSSIPNTDR